MVDLALIFGVFINIIIVEGEAKTWTETFYAEPLAAFLAVFIAGIVVWFTDWLLRCDSAFEYPFL